MPRSEESKGSGYRERNSTADRTLDVLGMFSDSRLRISATDLAAELGVARSTAYRYLQTLTAEGFIEEDPSGGFRLGLRILELARLARRSYGLTEVAAPILRELAEATHETALLTRRSGDRVVCLDKIDDETHQLRLTYERGSVLPLNSGASAWILLAWEEPEAARRAISDGRLVAHTAASLTEPGAILTRLAQIREQGYAISRGELDPDTIGIAAPIRDEAGRVVAGASLVGLARRIEPEVADHIGRVVEAAERISHALSVASQ